MSGAVLGMELMREGAQAIDRGDIVKRRAVHRAALARPSSAARTFTSRAVSRRRSDRGRPLRRIEQALPAIGPIERRMATCGFNHYWAGRLADADLEFRRTLALDPEHAGALLGLGLVAARQERWTDAEALLRRSLAADEGLLDTHRRLADLLVKRGEYEQAIAAYEKSLALAMAGHKALGGLIATERAGIRLLDDGHWKTHARLARLYEAERRRGEGHRRVSHQSRGRPRRDASPAPPRPRLCQQQGASG